MVTRNVVLTEIQGRRVQALVGAGRYQNMSEAIRADLRPLEQDDAQITGIRQELLEGLTVAKGGDFAEGCCKDAIGRAFATRSALS